MHSLVRKLTFVYDLTLIIRFSAHKLTFEKTGMLHQDISDKSIIIAEREPSSPNDDPKSNSSRPLGRGLLVDWELSRDLGKLANEILPQRRWASTSRLQT